MALRTAVNLRTINSSLFFFLSYVLFLCVNEEMSEA